MTFQQTAWFTALGSVVKVRVCESLCWKLKTILISILCWSVFAWAGTCDVCIRLFYFSYWSYMIICSSYILDLSFKNYIKDDGRKLRTHTSVFTYSGWLNSALYSVQTACWIVKQFRKVHLLTAFQRWIRETCVGIFLKPTFAPLQCDWPKLAIFSSFFLLASQDVVIKKCITHSKLGNVANL